MRVSPLMLFIIFLILKLTDTIHWSWTWVTAPLWISTIVFVGWFVILMIIGAIAGVFKD